MFLEENIGSCREVLDIEERKMALAEKIHI